MPGRRALMTTPSGRSRIRSTAALLALGALLAVAGAVTAVATGTAAPAATGVEDDGAGCPVTLPGSVPATAKLPDPFTRLDGTRITTKSDWRCRREEIAQLAEKYVYGAKPARPSTVS